MEQKQRVIVYIDGFNFSNQELIAVKYFPAKPDEVHP